MTALERTSREFTPTEVVIQELGRTAVKFIFMTQEDLDFWWSSRDGQGLPNFGVEMLGEDF